MENDSLFATELHGKSLGNETTSIGEKFSTRLNIRDILCPLWIQVPVYGCSGEKQTNSFGTYAVVDR